MSGNILSAFQNTPGFGAGGNVQLTTFKRLKKAVIMYKGESVTCSVSWDSDACSFEYYRYHGKEIRNFRGVYDEQSKIYSVILLNNGGEEQQELPVFQYDGQQRISRVYNEDHPSESWEVAYDQKNEINMEDQQKFAYDSDSRTVIISSYGHEGFKPRGKAIVDSKGNFETLISIFYENNDNGTV